MLLITMEVIHKNQGFVQGAGRPESFPPHHTFSP